MEHKFKLKLIGSPREKGYQCAVWANDVDSKHGPKITEYFAGFTTSDGTIVIYNHVGIQVGSPEKRFAGIPTGIEKLAASIKTARGMGCERVSYEFPKSIAEEQTPTTIRSLNYGECIALRQAQGLPALRIAA